MEEAKRVAQRLLGDGLALRSVVAVGRPVGL